MSEVYSKKTPTDSHGWGKPIILWKQAGNIIVSFSAVTQRRHTPLRLNDDIHNKCGSDYP